MSAELSDMKALWNRYNETGDYDSLIIATRPFYEKSLAAGDSAGRCLIRCCRIWNAPTVRR